MDGKRPTTTPRPGGPSIVFASGLQMALTGMQLAKNTISTAVEAGLGKRADTRNAVRMLELLKLMEDTILGYQTSTQEMYPDRYGYMIRNVGPKLLEVLEEVEKTARLWEEDSAGPASDPTIN